MPAWRQISPWRSWMPAGWEVRGSISTVFCHDDRLPHIVHNCLTSGLLLTITKHFVLSPFEPPVECFPRSASRWKFETQYPILLLLKITAQRVPAGTWRAAGSKTGFISFFRQQISGADPGRVWNGGSACWRVFPWEMRQPECGAARAGSRPDGPGRGWCN